jgi:hypothetical protein
MPAREDRRRSANCHYARLVIVLLNVPQIASTAAMAVYSIWFDRYELRGVGPGVIYAAYALLVILCSQIGNGVVLLFLRRNKVMAAFLVRVALVSLAGDAFFIWLGARFIYTGT